ncbi:MAG: zinc-dependent alcohol dehydrogenase family protein [Firmicutes bacterium]|nr:zinc-dependent alcohol dehydrogenase family protein [Bacillota bacterium]
MLAANFMEVGKLKLEEKTVAQPGKGEVLIKVKAAGICGTDSHIVKGQSSASPPVILGHEYAGEIVELGEGVNNFHLGERVIADPNLLCGMCFYCRNGNGHLCENLRALGVDLDGGFAEYALVPEVQLHRLPGNMDFEEGAFVEPVACCIRGLQQAGIQVGDEVAILGGGPIGLILLQLAKAAGGKVTLSEPVESKWGLARAVGADHIVSPGELPENTFDVVIEASGARTAIEQSTKTARRGASIVWFGVFPLGERVSIEPHDTFRKELRISGSFINPNTHAQAIHLISTGVVKVKPLISHHFSLREIETALELHDSGTANKIMIIPNY